MLDAKIINIVKLYIHELIKNNVLISKAMLYGSYSRNEANEESDIDLILISPIFDNDRDKYLGIIWKLTELSDFRIEPVAIGEKRFNEDNISPIIQIAKQEGIEIEF